MKPNNETSPSLIDANRVAYSPTEYAALFGRQQTWGYRQLYRGTVKAITRCGRILIPRCEVDRLLRSAEEYNGKPRPRMVKKQKIKPDLSPGLFI